MDRTPKLYFLGETEEEANLLVGKQWPIDPEGLVGNARGRNSTDLQFERAMDLHVASGENSFIGGGRNNLVSGNNSFAAAGSDNELAADMAFAAGESNSVCGRQSAAFGAINEVLGNCAFAKGTGHAVTGDVASAEGDGQIVSGYSAHAEGGLGICEGAYSHTEGLAARAYLDFQHAKASGGFSNPGEIDEAQYTNVIARLAAEENYPLPLKLGEEGVIILMNNKVCYFRISVIASTRIELSLNAKAWELKGIISKGDSPASTQLLGPSTKTVLSGTSPEWDVNIEADTTQGALNIMAVAPSGPEIRWVAFVELVEVAFYS